MNKAILVAGVTVLFVTASCGTREDQTSAQRSASQPSSSESGDAGTQPLLDPDCNDGAPPPYDTSPMFSATHVGETDGTVDLGNGQSVTIHFLPISPLNGFPAFAWSATTPIAIVTETYLANRPPNRYPEFPPTTSGQTYFMLTNGPITFLPPEEVTAKFCFLANPTPPSDAGTGGEGSDAGGNGSGTDAGALDSGGGKAW